MSFPWIVRISISVLLLSLSTTAFGFSTHTDEWTEEAPLHDGRIIKINREVYWSFHLFMGDEGGLTVMESYPDKYWFKFVNPDTKETIKWHGEQDYSPVLLDILDGVPYLAVQGPQDPETKTKYLCPEVPYFFYKYDRRVFGNWIPVTPKQFPGILKNANLSPTVPDDIMDYYKSYRGGAPKEVSKPKSELTHDDVLANIKSDEKRSGGQLRSIIPHECPVWQEPSVIVLPPPQKVDLEILESKVYSPEKSFDPDDLFDKKKTSDCVSLIKSEDPRNLKLAGRYVFVNDKTGLNKVQFKSFAIPSFSMFCDGNDVWFPNFDNVDGYELTKYSSAGEMIYRIVFQKPFPAFINFSSVKSNDGYLYFDMWDSHNDADGGHLKRSLKVRFLEPKTSHINATKSTQ